jgi:hypothetical protein
LPFIVLNIQIKVLIIQRTACLHFQRSMLSKPNAPVVNVKVKITNDELSILHFSQPVKIQIFCPKTAMVFLKKFPIIRISLSRKERVRVKFI